MDDALTKENASIMVHNILPRVLNSSIPNWEEVGEEPAEEYRRMVCSKAWRTKVLDLKCIKSCVPQLIEILARIDYANRANLFE